MNGLQSYAILKGEIDNLKKNTAIPDFDQTDENAKDYIKNKPTIVGKPGTGEFSEVHNDADSNTASGKYSNAFGLRSTASGDYSIVNGTDGVQATGDFSIANGRYGTTAKGLHSVAIGRNGVAANGDCSLAFGDSSVSTSNKYSLAFGYGSISAGGYASLAFGSYGTSTNNNNSFAFGNNAHALADFSYAFGQSATASANFSLAFGGGVTARGDYSVSIGGGSETSGEYALSFGSSCKAQSPYSLAIGSGSQTGSQYSIAIGGGVKTNGNSSLAIGQYSTTYGDYAIAIGEGESSSNNTVASGGYSYARGEKAKASGQYAYVEGKNASASDNYSYARGDSAKASGRYAYAIGEYGVEATSYYAYARGSNTCKASGGYSHAEGRYAVEASGEHSHAEGSNSICAKGNYSYAFGYNSTSEGTHSHAEGKGLSAYGINSYAFGENFAVSGKFSHAEGQGNGRSVSGDYSYGFGETVDISGNHSHGFGYGITISGEKSNAFGEYIALKGSNSHAFGSKLSVTPDDCFVTGALNIDDDTNTLAFAVGNGKLEGTTTIHSNAYTLDKSGNGWFAGNIYVGSTSGTHKDGGSKLVLTEDSTIYWSKIKGTPFVGEEHYSEEAITCNSMQYGGTVYDQTNYKIAATTKLPINQNINGDARIDIQWGNSSMPNAPLKYVKIYDSDKDVGYITALVLQGYEDKISLSHGEYILNLDAIGEFAVPIIPLDIKNYKGGSQFLQSASVNSVILTFSKTSTITRIENINVSLRLTIYPKVDNKYLSEEILDKKGRSGLGENSEIFNNYVSNDASGDYSHAEGYRNTASGDYSHAEGAYNIASGRFSHAECQSTTASGEASHTEGWGSKALSHYSHAEGYGTKTPSKTVGSHVGGVLNIPEENVLVSIGNGYYSNVVELYDLENNSDQYRSNAYTLDKQGNGWFSGDVYVGSTSGKNKDDGSKKLATEEYVNNIISFDDDGNLTITIGGVSKKFAPIS